MGALEILLIIACAGIAAAIARIARLAETRRKRNNLPKIKGRSRVDRLGSVLFRCVLFAVVFTR